MQIHFRSLSQQTISGFEAYLLPATRRSLRQQTASCIVIGAVIGQHSCGAAAALVQDGSALLTDLFVDEAIRRQGVGAGLLDTILKELAGQDVRSVTVSYALDPDMQPVMEHLLRSRGFGSPALTAQTYRTHTSDYRDSAVLRRAFQPDYRPPAGIVPFSQLSAAALEALSQNDDIDEALTWQANRDRADAQLSLALLDGDTVTAYLLCCESDDGGYVLLAAYANEDAPYHAFLSLLVSLINQCYYRSGDFPFYFSATNDHVQALALRIMDGNYTVYNEYTCYLILE